MDLLRDASVMARARIMFSLPRLRSAAPLSWRILDHLLWPARRPADVEIGALRWQRVMEARRETGAEIGVEVGVEVGALRREAEGRSDRQQAGEDAIVNNV